MNIEDQNVLSKRQIDAACHQILPALFEEHAEHHPKHPALIFQNQKISYAELNARSNQVAHYLRTLNDNHKTMVAICMKPSFDLLIGIIGILKSGSAYVPLDPNNPISRLQFILEDTQANTILTHSSDKNLFENTNAHLICFDTDFKEINHHSKKNPQYINQPNDLAYIIYTSGSTGKPKGVMITHSNVQCFINWYSKALSVVKEDIFDFSSSVSFDFAVANTLFPLMHGSTIAICSESVKKDPYLYLNHLSENKVSIAKTTPSHFRNIKDVVLSEKKPLFLRYMVFGGDSLFASDIKDWLAQFPQQTMFCEYGPTEATVATSWIKIDKKNINQFNKIPIGKAALNTELYILDNALNPVPVGEIAELYIGGVGVAKGYLNRKETTAERFIQNPFNNTVSDRLYKTGDYCRFLPDGNVEFIERVDNQVKIRGFRIEMEEIETLLMSHPNIKEAVVIAKQLGEPTADKQLIAYCVLKQAGTLNLNELRAYLKESLPEYMIPSFFEILTAFPLSSNGKIDRFQLPEIKRRVAVEENMDFTCTELELSLKTIWEEALYLDYINVHDNFFDLGGNSLSAARILSQIRQNLKKDISLQDFYNTLTISQLAKVVNEANNISESDVPAPDTNIDTIPLSELQFLFWLMRLFYPQAKILNIIDRKRLNGDINVPFLNTALNLVCKNQPILSYHIHRFSPIQNWQELPAPQIEEIDLRHLSPADQEQELLSSLDQLQHSSWSDNDYLFKVTLFHLANGLSELHLSVSHFISDEISSELFFKDLSRYYLASLNNSDALIDPARKQFKDFIIEENINTKNNLDNYIHFWDGYLYDASPLNIPGEQITNDDEPLNTCYTPISDNLLMSLQSFCTEKRLCLSETLAASIGLSMAPYFENNTSIINLVNSTRNHSHYDDTIGLFIRSDVIKIDVNDSPDFLELSHKVQKTINEASAYQSCPTIVKLGCLYKQESMNHSVTNALASGFTTLYAKLFPKYKLDARVLKMFFRVAATKTSNQFFINMNIMNSFVSTSKETSLLGLNLMSTPPHQSDKTVDKNILNVWFYRDSENKANMILSGNLKMPFLESISKEIINRISKVLS